MNGFEILVPQISHDCNYSITGSESQVLSIVLKSHASVECEPGKQRLVDTFVNIVTLANLDRLF